MRRIATLAVTFLVFLAAICPAKEPVWLDSVDDAVAAARKSDRQILVDFYADWCGWCKRLDAVVFSSSEFHPYAERFVLLRVDVEDGGEGTRLYDRFGAVSLPTTMILDHRLSKVGEVKGFSPAEPFLAKLDREIENGQMLDHAFDKVKRSGQPARIQELAEELHSRRDGVRAAELYALLLANDATPSDQLAWFQYLRADALRLGGEFGDAAEEAAIAHAVAAKSADLDLLERIDFLRFRIARDEGRCAFAIEALQTFLANYPDSRLSGFAEQELDTLRHEPATECT